METDQDWADNIASVVWPQGWTYENVTLTTNMTHPPYLMGDECWSMVLRDSNSNTWHMYQYPEDFEESVFSNIECIPFQVNTLEGIQSELSNQTSSETSKANATPPASEATKRIPYPLVTSTLVLSALLL